MHGDPANANGSRLERPEAAPKGVPKAKKSADQAPSRETGVAPLRLKHRRPAKKRHSATPSKLE